MIKINSLFIAGLAWALAIGLTSCIPPKPTEKEIVGLWVERRATSRVDDDGPCAYFEFSAVGQFRAYQIPREYFIGRSVPLQHLTRVDASGTWTLDVSAEDPFALHRVRLDFGPVPGFPLGFSSGLLITYPPERVLLAGLSDDPDVTFYKKDKPECR